VKGRPESSAFAFVGSLAFSLLTLTQAAVGLSLNRSWDPVSIIFAAMSSISGGFAVYFWMAMMRKIRERAARVKPQATSGGAALGMPLEH
jgi:hypothetical protein